MARDNKDLEGKAKMNISEVLQLAEKVDKWKCVRVLWVYDIEGEVGDLKISMGRQLLNFGFLEISVIRGEDSCYYDSKPFFYKESHNRRINSFYKNTVSNCRKQMRRDAEERQRKDLEYARSLLRT